MLDLIDSNVFVQTVLSLNPKGATHIDLKSLYSRAKEIDAKTMGDAVEKRDYAFSKQAIISAFMETMKYSFKPSVFMGGKSQG